ncbi:MAG: RNA polymerase sigma factor [Clostridia bacterium]|nr:RNA polymerase sigma factor [Clostridia bacterium]
MDNGAGSYRRFLDGDDSGIVEIIRDYKDGLTLYLNGYVRNIFTAEELMEETFFRLMTKKPKFKGKSSFKTWLYAIGRNTATDYLRKQSKTALQDEMSDEIISEENSVEKEYLKEESKIRLYKAMKRIKPEYEQVLYLTFFEGCSNEQAASVMKKNRRQIENLVYRAKKALKVELEKEDFTYEGL